LVKTFKEYFKIRNEINELKLKKEKTTSRFDQVDINIEIRRLEYKLFNFDIRIESYLNDDERNYIKLKYVDKLSGKALESVLHRSVSTLARYEHKILNKLLF
jgi:hypothetical protein